MPVEPYNIPSHDDFKKYKHRDVLKDSVDYGGFDAEIRIILGNDVPIVSNPFEV